MVYAGECYSEGMAFEPDIIVTGPESSDIAVVIEAKTSVCKLETSERQLKSFMSAMRCPVGVIVTPQRLWLYRDRYLGMSEESIERVAEFDIENVLNFELSGASRRDGIAFERFVQQWLEGLGTEAGLRELPTELRRAVESYVVPAISQGTIRAGHPRAFAQRITDEARLCGDELGGSVCGARPFTPPGGLDAGAEG